MFSLIVAEVLLVKLVSLPYSALIAWPPRASDEVVNVAEPFTRVSVSTAVSPSKKVTVPVGDPLPGATAVTVAWKLRDWPRTAGLSEVEMEVLVPSWLTVWVKAVEVLTAKSVLPRYCAVMEWPLTERAEVVNAAVPPLRSSVSMGVLPS